MRSYVVLCEADGLYLYPLILMRCSGKSCGRLLDKAGLHTLCRPDILVIDDLSFLSYPSAVSTEPAMPPPPPQWCFLKHLEA